MRKRVKQARNSIDRSVGIMITLLYVSIIIPTERLSEFRACLTRFRIDLALIFAHAYTN